ncbi:DUF503 domain-containing protein [Syntrophomonas palmitatica]|uniref:DUF503 domain-containing protein n=1 Tax=Syntrophomonas palmitatica TaxID=402877 RepID=UPI0006D19636|nr:DUF503 domain-containing protein [Syntrophomonas palmitatica]
MYVVYGYAELHFPYANSLKDKRQLTQGIINRMKKRFNISLAETGFHDLWQRANIGFSVVSNQPAELDHILDAIRNAFQYYSSDMELINFTYEYQSL